MFPPSAAWGVTLLSGLKRASKHLKFGKNLLVREQFCFLPFSQVKPFWTQSTNASCFRKNWTELIFYFISAVFKTPIVPLYPVRPVARNRLRTLSRLSFSVHRSVRLVNHTPHHCSFHSRTNYTISALCGSEPFLPWWFWGAGLGQGKLQCLHCDIAIPTL